MDKKMDAEDKKKFEEMYLKFQYVLRKIAYLNEIPFDYIDDVVHDTFISYARYDYSLDLPPENLKMLLIKILKSRCMDYHRRMKRRAMGSWMRKPTILKTFHPMTRPQTYRILW